MWIKNFLQNRTQKVAVNKSYSKTSRVKSGVPQGSVLGPLLFVIFVADVPELVNNFVDLFADDTKLYSYLPENSGAKTISVHNSITLQQDLSNLKQWSDKMLMSFNMPKCHVLHLGNNNTNINYYLPIQTNNKNGTHGMSYVLSFMSWKKTT